MLSRNLEQSLHRALANANERRHEYATLEHLLLALTEDTDAVAVLNACNVDLDTLRKELSGYLDGQLPNLVVDSVEDARRARFIFAGQSLERRRIERFRRLSGRAGIGREAKTLKASDMLALDENVPGGVDFGF